MQDTFRTPTKSIMQLLARSVFELPEWRTLTVSEADMKWNWHTLETRSAGRAVDTRIASQRESWRRRGHSIESATDEWTKQVLCASDTQNNRCVTYVLPGDCNRSWCVKRLFSVSETRISRDLREDTTAETRRTDSDYVPNAAGGTGSESHC